MADEIITSPDTSTELEPYRHAPTLLAGSTSGSGGKVKVWTPTWQEIWQCTKPFVIKGTMGAFFMAIWNVIWPSKDRYFPLVYWSIWAGCFLLTALLTRLTMPYVTTDDAGIGLTTLKGSEAYRWNQIRSVEKAEDWFHPLLWFNVGERQPVTCNMLGHSTQAQQELLDLIIEKAQLVRDGSKPSKFIRSSSAVSIASSPDALPPAKPD